MESSEIVRLFPGSVLRSRVPEGYVQDLNDRARLRPDPLPRSTAGRALVESWADFLSPHFAQGSACNFTGTYSDAYGYSHGLMLARNVIKDFHAFRRSLRRSSAPAVVGVEYHPSTHRAVLHFHAMIGGEWSERDLSCAEAVWVASRGWAKAKAVVDRDGCVEYAAKHLLKQGADDVLEFWLPPESYSCKTEWRLARKGVRDAV